MTIHKCDICGKESNQPLDEMVFTSVKRCYWIYTTYREDVLDVCKDCQRDFRTVLDKKVNEVKQNDS